MPGRGTLISAANNARTKLLIPTSYITRIKQLDFVFKTLCHLVKMTLFSLIDPLYLQRVF